APQGGEGGYTACAYLRRSGRDSGFGIRDSGFARRHGGCMRRLLMCFVAVVVLGAGERALERAALAQKKSAPQYRVDPRWPKMPAKWVLGQVSGLDVDSRDHVWIIQRPWSLADDEKAQNADAACCFPAPPVMEFDAAGNYVQGWGGEDPGPAPGEAPRSKY